MNIFWLDYDLQKCAEYHCDKHIVKMILESAQLLSTACRVSGINEGYKISHLNNPISLWVRSSLGNWLLLRDLTYYLNEEYKFRYGKSHKSFDVINSLTIPNIENLGITEPPRCMPSEYLSYDLVDSYRNYYIGDKQHIASWKNRDAPWWFIYRNRRSTMYDKYYDSIKGLPVIFNNKVMSLEDFIRRVPDCYKLKVRNSIILSTEHNRKTIFEGLKLTDFYRCRNYLNNLILGTKNDNELNLFQKRLLGYLGREEYKRDILLNLLDYEKINFIELIKLVSGEFNEKDLPKLNKFGLSIRNIITKYLGYDYRLQKGSDSVFQLFNTNAIFRAGKLDYTFIITPQVIIEVDILGDYIKVNSNRKVKCNSYKFLRDVDNLISMSINNTVNDVNKELLNIIKKYME